MNPPLPFPFPRGANGGNDANDDDDDKDVDDIAPTAVDDDGLLPLVW